MSHICSIKTFAHVNDKIKGSNRRCPMGKNDQARFLLENSQGWSPFTSWHWKCHSNKNPSTKIKSAKHSRLQKFFQKLTSEFKKDTFKYGKSTIKYRTLNKWFTLHENSSTFFILNFRPWRTLLFMKNSSTFSKLKSIQNGWI